MPGALDGVRVLDFGQYIAGPLAAMLMGDQGADVVRIDPPGGPRMDAPANATWNRGKRRITLDLHSAEDLEIARGLVAGADVLIENFRPGVMDRLGLGSAASRAANPGLIYVSLPGFAAGHPLAAAAAWEGVVGAAANLYTRPGDPVFTAIPISSSYAAFHASVATAMALVARDRDGVGQHIEIPLYDATFTAIGYRAQKRHDATAMSDIPAVGMQMPWFGPHLAADGRYVYFHIANKNAMDFIAAAGASEWWDAQDAPDRIAALFATRSAQAWEDLGSEVGTEMAVCTTSAEWLDHPHARESGMVAEVQDPDLGAMIQPGLAVRLSETPGAIRGPAHAPDADRDSVAAQARLAARPSSPPPAPAASAQGVPHTPLTALRGVRVLDLCIVLAGPTAARTLGEYGADVIKIDGPPRPSVIGPGGGDPQIGAAFNIEVNRGKRSIVLDLTTQDGLDIFWMLVEEADVVVENYRHGVVDRLGVGYEDVRKRRPNIIYASLNAYGYTGPWAHRPGHEQLGQSVTGMSLRFGGEAAPVLQSVALNDFGTGLIGAYGIGLALLHRERTGQGQRVTGSLAQTACTLQSLFLQDYDGKVWDEPRGQDARGYGPLHRLYRASDGWLMLAAPATARSRLEGVAGLESIAGCADGDALADALSTALSAAPVAHWVDALRAADIGATGLGAIRAMMDDPYAIARGLSLTREHQGIGLVQTTGPAPMLSGTPLRPGRPAPSPGADSADIIAELGLDARLAALIDAGAVRV
ncbi:MAG: putative acyl-CoA transferase/carnitine dehydratase [Jatrophihabitantaceae bacterium]|nr:putative acyl-CoA transferase/carnitine dehydratase [Jatrophihabitantaceae bacterium]